MSLVGSLEIVVDVPRGASESLGSHVVISLKVVVSRCNFVTIVVAVESIVSVFMSG